MPKPRANLTLDRRTMLRGACGAFAASIGLPPLDAMFDRNGTAYADGTPIPQRFALWWWAQGVILDKWLPKMVNPKPWNRGATTVGSYDDDWAASSELAPFVDKGLKSDISLVSDAHLNGFIEIVHLGHEIGLTSGYGAKLPGLYGLTWERPSIVKVMADRWRSSARFPLLAVNVCGDADDSNAASVPAEESPAKLFDRVFGGTDTQVKMGLPSPRFSAATRKSILDLVLADANRLRGRVGAGDRARVDAHLQGIRDLELRLVKDPPTTGTTTNPVTRPAEPAKSDFTARHDAFARLLAAAIATGQTRVISVTMDSSQSGAVYSELGAKKGIHEMTHPPEGDAVTTKEYMDMLHKIATWKMERLATLVSYLKEIPEGAGTVLDNCLLYATTEFGDPIAHSWDDELMIFAGKAGGAFRSGRYYKALHNGQSEVATNALLTILKAFGQPETEWGADSKTVAPPGRTDLGPPGFDGWSYGHTTNSFGALLV